MLLSKKEQNTKEILARASQASRPSTPNFPPPPPAMLDAFEIITTSGVVLWSKSYAPIGAGLINSLIRDVFIEEKGDNATQKPTYTKDGFTLKWTTAKDLGLVFVVCTKPFS